MQQVEGTLSGGAEDPSEPKHPGFLSPGRAFLLLLIALAIAGVWLWTSRESPPPDVATETKPTVLTDAEAIAIFERLDDLSQQMYEEKDLTLMSQIYTPSSKIRSRAERELRQLIRDKVVMDVKAESLRLTIMDKTSERVVIEEQALVNHRFYTLSGKDVTKSTRPELQTTHWTLKQIDGDWFIDDALIVAAEPA